MGNTLGQVLVALSDKEDVDARRSEIANVLSQKEDQMRGFFLTYLKKNSDFKKYAAKRYNKKVHGFKVGSVNYIDKCALMAVDELELVPSVKSLWNFYDSIFGAIVEAEKPHLHELFLTDYDGKENGDALIKHIISNASGYEIYSSDIAWFYKYWYFKEKPSIKKKITSLTELDHSISQNAIIHDLQSEVSQQHQGLLDITTNVSSISEKIDGLSKTLNSDAVTEAITLLQGSLNSLEERLRDIEQRNHSIKTIQHLPATIK